MHARVWNQDHVVPARAQATPAAQLRRRGARDMHLDHTRIACCALYTITLPRSPPAAPPHPPHASTRYPLPMRQDRGLTPSASFVSSNTNQPMPAAGASFSKFGSSPL